MKKLLILLIICSVLFFAQSCEKENKGNESKISKAGESESHHNGENCMNCHKSGGEGEGWFQVAGTVYDSSKTTIYPNSIVRLFTGPNGTGTLKYTIYGDQLGNFYTTENMDFGTGLYPSVEGNNDIKYMSTSITIGACNSCHGQSTDPLWTE